MISPALVHIPTPPAPVQHPQHAPLAAQTRDGLVESVHYGSAIAVAPDGGTLLAAGDPLAPFYPRSALKPLQAVAMVRAGLELPDELLALTAASHSGAARHRDGALRILDLHGLTPGDLANSSDLPYGVREREEWLAGGGQATQLAQNCSGKHAAMAATCVINGWPVQGYLAPEHPLQQLVARTVAELTGEDPERTSTDGCGTPLFALSLRGMARAFGRLAADDAGSAEAAVARSMRRHPDMVAGEDRDVTALMRLVPGLLAKDGFEGVQLVGLPDGRGVAVKISDGGDRARMPVTVRMLAGLGVDTSPLARLAALPVLGGGRPVGLLQATDFPVAPDLRSEHDLLGDRDVPADAYWGVHTLRAVENFPITGQPLSSNMHLVRGLAAVKLAAARANRELGLLDAGRARAIEDACADVMDGKLSEQFVVDVIQGGAGTSSNMNANEVIANRALEILGHPKGDYARLHPNDHVNLSQSTNDVYPTAVKLGTIFAARQLLDALAELEDAFAAKALEFRTVVKMGRTQLQDAVPMTLGQEFGTYAVTIGEDRLRLAEADLLIHEINLGATAIGTGLNAPAGYAEAACRHLAEITGLPLVTAADLIEATQDVGAFVHLSGVLKRVAVKLSKICNDLRLLSSGPRAGLGEINLPAVQSGSSIMPGKINPVIPEVVSQVAYEVIGNDVTITMAAEAGQLQLNAFEPIIVHSLHKSISHLEAACRTLTSRCVRGITANTERLRLTVEQSIGLVTALNPHLGYATATAIAQEALATGKGVAELVLEHGLLTDGQLTELLSPQRLANLSK